MLDHSEIAALVAELQPRLEGGQVQKIREPEEGTVVLSVRVPGRTTWLVLSVVPGLERIAEAESAATLPEPSTLGRWLRSVLKGRRLEGVRQIEGDRVVVLDFEEGSLVAELTGRHANLIGLDAQGRIKALSHRTSSLRRTLRPGHLWSPPLQRTMPATTPRWASALEVERVARRLGAEREAADVQGRRERLLRDALRKVRRLHARVTADLGRAQAADALRRQGELLKGQLYLVERGMEQVEVQDWYAEGAPMVSLPLDPRLDGPGNVERLFQRYRKAQAGQKRASARLAEVSARLARVEAFAELGLPELEAALRQEGLGPKTMTKGARRVQAPRLPYREFQSARGERILVGRGGADNHALTFRIARGNDHWLHVRDAPGAHVVVPLPAKDREPHRETLLDAAALAVHHSDLRGEPGLDVTHTRRKHVRAVKGAGPGRVTIAAAKSINVEDQAARITRLYAP